MALRPSRAFWCFHIFPLRKIWKSAVYVRVYFIVIFIVVKKNFTLPLAKFIFNVKIELTLKIF
ncbi:hypothetical protein B9G55_07305 [Saccharibacillus sp. O16]|nr:hypothetical protein B9G55_07305 [Saccharibacillus sp. O16]